VGRGGEESGEKKRREEEGRPLNVRKALKPLQACHIVKIVLHINRE